MENLIEPSKKRKGVDPIEDIKQTIMYRSELPGVYMIQFFNGLVVVETCSPFRRICAYRSDIILVELSQVDKNDKPIPAKPLRKSELDVDWNNTLFVVTMVLKKTGPERFILKLESDARLLISALEDIMARTE